MRRACALPFVLHVRCRPASQAVNAATTSFDAEKAAAQVFIGKYSAQLAALGHWSMRRKTAVLEDMAAELLSDKQATRHAYIGALWTAASAGHTRITQKLFETMSAQGMLGVGDASPFDALLKVQTVCTQPSLADIQHAWQLMQAHSIRPTRRTVELLCRGLTQTGHRATADGIAAHALRDGIDVDLPPEDKPLLAPAPSASLEDLRRCVATRDAGQAEARFAQLLADEKKGEEAVTAAHWNELMRVYAACGNLGPVSFSALPYEHTAPSADPNGLQGVWARLLTSGGSPDEWAYDHLLHACAACPRFAEDTTLLAVRAFLDADRKGFAEEQHLWVRLVQVLARAGDGDAAEEALRQMWERQHHVRRDSRIMKLFAEATSAWLTHTPTTRP